MTQPTLLKNSPKRNENICPNEKTYTEMFIAALFIIDTHTQKRTAKCPLTDKWMIPENIMKWKKAVTKNHNDSIYTKCLE